MRRGISMPLSGLALVNVQVLALRTPERLDDAPAFDALDIGRLQKRTRNAGRKTVTLHPKRVAKPAARTRPRAGFRPFACGSSARIPGTPASNSKRFTTENRSTPCVSTLPMSRCRRTSSGKPRCGLSAAPSGIARGADPPRVSRRPRRTCNAGCWTLRCSNAEAFVVKIAAFSGRSSAAVHRSLHKLSSERSDAVARDLRHQSRTAWHSALKAEMHIETSVVMLIVTSGPKSATSWRYPRPGRLAESDLETGTHGRECPRLAVTSSTGILGRLRLRVHLRLDAG